MVDYFVFAVTSVLAILVFIFFFLYKQQNVQEQNQHDHRTQIPGPKPANTMEGNFPDIIKSGGINRFLIDIHRQYGPITSFWWGQEMMVSLASPELFKYQAKDFNRAYSLMASFKQLFGENAIAFANGEDGKRRHKAYTACFSTHNIEKYYSILNKRTDELIDQWRQLVNNEPINLEEQLLNFTAKMNLQCVMGTYFDDEQKVADAWHVSIYMWNEVQRQLRGDNAEQDTERRKIFLDNQQKLRSILKDAYEHRLNNRADEEENLFIDVITDMDMDEDVKIDDMADVLFSSIHVSAFVMIWTLFFLGENPEIQEKAYREIHQILGNKQMDEEIYNDLHYLRQVIQETLRWTALVPFTLRYKDTDCEIAGYHIPAKTSIVHAVGAVSQDPSIFPQPQKFNPERFTPGNMRKLPALSFEPFGFAGKRKCPGHKLALLEVTLVLAEILKAFKISLIDGQTATPVDGLITQPAEQVWITLDRRQ